MQMMRASFRGLRSSSSVGLFGSITRPRKNNNNLLQIRWLNTNIYTMENMEVGVNKLVHALKGLVAPKKKEDLVMMSKNNGFSAIKEILKDDVTRGQYDPNLYKEYVVQVGVKKLVHALKGLVVHKKEDLVLMSKDNGFSDIEKFQLELEDPEEKLGVTIVEGMQFDYRFLLSHFLDKIPFDNENCNVLLVDKITNAKDLASVLKDAIKGGYPILIITFDVNEEALDAFVASSWPLGEPKIAVLKTLDSWGSRGDYLDDIALLTGATVIKEEVGLNLENVESEVLGFAAKVVVANGYTTIVSDGSRKELLNREAEKIRDRVMTLAKGLEIDRWDESTKEIYLAAQLMREIERLDQRLVRLYGGVAVAEVDTATQKEVEEKKQRFNVALDKLKMAFRKGIVAGGGCPRCILDNDEHKEAVEFVKTTLSYPIKQIAKDAGVDENVVVEKVLSSDDPYYGYNVAARTSKNLMAAKSRLTGTIKSFASYLIYLEDNRVKQVIDLIDELIYEHGL